jgi:hypothetical protein
MVKALFIFCIIASALIANAQTVTRKWYDGTLYHTDGEVFKGLISWTPPRKGEHEDGDEVLYRYDANAETIPVPYYKVKCFTMGTDSFVVSHNVLFKNTPFMIVALDNATKVYEVKSAKKGIPIMLNTDGGGANFGVGMGIATTIGGGTKTTWYYGANADNVTRLHKKNFIEIMSKIMADKPEVAAKIKDQTFRYGNIISLLFYYKTGQIPKHSDEY